MEEKKIATSVDILINIDRFEHLQVTKYAEKKITYESQEEMIRKEDQLTDELVQDVIRTINAIPAKFSSSPTPLSPEKVDKIAATSNAIQDKISKKIPTWLTEGSDPNIANTASKISVKNGTEAYAKKEDDKAEKESIKSASMAETELFLNGGSDEKPDEKPKEVEKPKAKLDMDDDLFSDEDQDLFK